MHRRNKLLACLTLALLAPQVHSQQQFASNGPVDTTQSDRVILQYEVEWRLIRAGTARLAYSQSSNQSSHANLKLQSTGLVSKLYKVDDDYIINLDQQLCAKDSFMKAHEGRRRRETTVTYDAEQKKAFYLEKDLVKNNIANQKEIEIPGCVHDVIGGLIRLRTLKIEPGESETLPISDGKKFVMARIEAQEHEQVKTPAGTYKTIRYEAFLFNDVLYKRKGRLFVWITDDDRRLPVQIRARLQFHVGTITFQLEKEERP